MIGRPSGPGAQKAAGSRRAQDAWLVRGERQPGKGKKPEYTVYGRGGRGGQKRSAPQRKKPAAGSGGKREKPPYRVYRSRPSLRDRIRKPNLESIRRESGRGGRGGIRGFFGRLTGGKRPWLRWILIFAVGWLLLSFITFAISAQIQKGKLPQSAKDALKGGPAVLAGQNILILGGDRRGKTQHNASGTEGQGPPRADTIMVAARVAHLVQEALDPPRQLRRDPELRLAEDQRLPRLQHAEHQRQSRRDHQDRRELPRHRHQPHRDRRLRRLRRVHQHARRRHDRRAGHQRKKNGPVVCGDVDGGKKQGGVSLKLPPGDITLQGDKALAYARIRHNNCNPAEDDRDRAARQQQVLNAIKGRLTSITRFPYNFIKGPWIGWNAPKAFISDMGGFTLPQVAIAAIIGGSGQTNVLGEKDRTSISTDSDGSLNIPQSDCINAVKELTGSDPPHHAECSP